MNLSFKRITSSGGFIPEIDGLRFIAISSVVLFHLWMFFDVKDHHVYTNKTSYDFLTRLLSHGKYGVPLFFIISGFILGMPFAKYHLHQGKQVNIKQYFFRRLTRLEPPYILAMTILLFGSIYIAKTLNWHDGILSYLASIFYIHNFVYPGVYPFINNVAWSLEIEVQFYILAPAIAYIFTIRKPSFRRLLIVLAVIFFIIANRFITISFISLFNFIHYFLIGFLLVDLYISKVDFLPKTWFDKVITIILLFVIWLYDPKELASDYQKIIWEIFQLTCVFFLYYYILFHKVFRFFSSPLITNIGGMCYSIYLIHYAIISAIGNKLVQVKFSNYSFINIGIYCVILLFAIGIICSLFFLLIERPCMDKDWYKKIFTQRPIPTTDGKQV